jgi:choline dehydrogenase-like flavoprotein
MTDRAPFQLSASARETLRAVCDTFLPSITARDDEPVRLFALSARDVGVADAIEEAATHLRDAQQQEFRVLLGVLGNPMTMLATFGHFSSFAALSAADRADVLLRMANSPIPHLRTAFQVLKRLSTYLFYAVTPNDADNPTWSDIGYTPSRNPPAIDRPLHVTLAERDRVIDCDVCIVGSGAGGSVIAAELAAAGRRVVVLEAAEPLQAPDFDQRELPGTRHLFLERGLLATTDSSITILAGAALGGGTTVNWQTSLRTPDDIRHEWAVASGCRHFTDRAFTFALDAVATRLSVGTDESDINVNNDVLRRGCEALGHGWTHTPRNSKGCDPAQCGYCCYGCRHGGKQTTAVTWLRDAQRLGECEILASCRAQRVMIRGGRATGVDAVATGADGRRHRIEVRATTVVVAGGSIESPALLLRSGLESSQIGRNLFLHPVTGIAGRYPEPVEPWKGPPQTVLCDRFARLDGLYGFMLEVAPAHPALLALALPWTNARTHRQQMSSAAHCSAAIMIVRDRSTGRVTVDREGRAVVDYQPGAAEIALLRRALLEGAKVHIAAGATEVATLHQREHGFMVTSASERELDTACDRLAASDVTRNRSTLFSAHQMGSCRMGSDPAHAVCDARGEVFGVRGLYIGDASAFPLSSGVNPMITIMAMAHHTAQAMK